MKQPYQEDHVRSASPCDGEAVNTEDDWWMPVVPLVASKLHELSLHVIPEDAEWCQDVDIEQEDASPMAWVAIVRNDTMLLDIGEENVPDVVMEIAQSLLDQEPVLGWDECSSSSSNDNEDKSSVWKGLRFHAYEAGAADSKVDGDEALIVWMFAAVYNSHLLSASDAKAFVQDQMVAQTAALRATDKMWRTGGHHACQFLFCPVLQQSLEACHEASLERRKAQQLRQRMGLPQESEDDEQQKVDLSLSHSIICKNQEIVERHLAQLEEDPEDEMLLELEEEAHENDWPRANEDAEVDLETAAATSGWRCTNVASFYTFEDFHDVHDEEEEHTHVEEGEEAQDQADDEEQYCLEVSSVEDEENDRMVSPDLSITLEQLQRPPTQEFAVVKPHDDDDSSSSSSMAPVLVESESSLSSSGNCDDDEANDGQEDEDLRYSDLWEATTSTIAKQATALDNEEKELPPSPSPITPSRDTVSSPSDMDSAPLEKPDEDDATFRSPEKTTPDKQRFIVDLASTSPTGIVDFPNLASSDIYEEFPKPVARKPSLAFCLGKSIKTRRRESHDISDGTNCFWCTLFAPKESALV